MGVVPAAAFVLLILTGLYLFAGPGYYAEARAVRKLAEALPGVTVLDVDGNHDFTLEDLWLEIDYRGTRLYFGSVTEGSFEPDGGYVDVAQVGEWGFTTRGYRSHSATEPFSYGAHIEFGPAGNQRSLIDLPIRSIPEFLDRLDEVKAVVMTLPEAPPGRPFDVPDNVNRRRGEVVERVWRRPFPD
jgi:hypothetical protein